MSEPSARVSPAFRRWGTCDASRAHQPVATLRISSSDAGPGKRHGPATVLPGKVTHTAVRPGVGVSRTSGCSDQGGRRTVCAALCVVENFLLNQAYWEPGGGCVPEWSLVRALPLDHQRWWRVGEWCVASCTLRLGRCVSGHGTVFTCASSTYTRGAPLSFFLLHM